MKLLTTPVFVPDDFQVPDGCERLELKTIEQVSEFYLGRTNDNTPSWYLSTNEDIGYSAFIAVMPKKYTYDWPCEFRDGAELILTTPFKGAKVWQFCVRDHYISFNSMAAMIPTLPDPPSDAPIGTIIVKGEK